MTLTTQFYTLLSMIGMGAFFGISLDTYQRFLKRGKRPRFIIFVNDILYWLLHGILVFYVLFLVNNGELRFYLLLALLCGFATYQALIKNIYLLLLEKAILFCIAVGNFLKKLFMFVIFRPIRALIMLIIALILFIGRALLSLVKGLGLVLLWLLKVAWYPFQLLGKGLLLLVPASWRSAVRELTLKVTRIFKRLQKAIMQWYKKIK